MAFEESDAILPSERRSIGDVSQIHDPWPAITPSAPYELVNNKFAQTLQMADDMMERLVGSDGNSGYLGMLNSLIASYNLPNVPDLTVDIDTNSIGVTVDPAPSPVPTASLSPVPSSPGPFLTTPPSSTVGSVTVDFDPVGVTVGAAPSPAPTADLSPIPVKPGAFTTTPPPISDLDGLITDFDAFDTLPPTPITLPTIDMSSLELVSPPDALVYSPINWSEIDLSSDVYPTLLARIMADLADGATGLAPAVEAELFARATARQAAENDKRTDEINAMYSGSRWAAPSGAFIAAQAELSNQIGRNNADINGKIMIQTSDLAQKNSQFIIDQARQLEAILRDTRDNESNRELDKEKQEIANQIAIYAETVRAYVSEMEGSKIYIEAQLSALQGAVEHNKGLFEVFTAQANVYSVVVSTQTKVNDAIISAYEAQVKSFEAEIAAHETKVKTYGVEWEGYAQEVKKYEADLQGYAEAVKAYEAYNKAVNENQRVIVDSNQSQVAKADMELRSNIAETEAGVSVFKSEVDGYDAMMRGFATEMQGYGIQVEKYKADLQGFDAEVSGYEAHNKAISNNQMALIENNKAIIAKADVQLRAIIAEIEASLEGYKSEMALKERVSNDMAQIASQSVASSLASTNVSAHMGYSGSESRSESYGHNESISQSDSFSNSVSESHSYEHDPTA